MKFPEAAPGISRRQLWTAKRMGPAAEVVDPTQDAGVAEAAGENSPQPKAATGPNGEGFDESPMLLGPKATFLTGVALGE